MLENKRELDTLCVTVERKWASELQLWTPPSADVGDSPETLSVSPSTSFRKESENSPWFRGQILSIKCVQVMRILLRKRSEFLHSFRNHAHTRKWNNVHINVSWSKTCPRKLKEECLFLFWALKDSIRGCWCAVLGLCWRSWGSWQEHRTAVACLMHLKSKEWCRKPLGSQKALQGYTSSDLLPATIS